VHVVRLAQRSQPDCQAAADLRACLAVLGPGPEVLGGVALLGLMLPGLEPRIDAVLLLPRGILVLASVDLPGPVLRLDAPIDGPWLADGWRLVRPDGATNPAGTACAAAAAVAARLGVPGSPVLEVGVAVLVGPYVRTVVQPAADLDRRIRVLSPSGPALVGLARELCNGVRPCGLMAAGGLLGVLAPGLRPVPPEVLAAEGFA